MVPFSGSRARKQHSPQKVLSAKSHFSWCPVSGLFSGCFRRLPRRVFGSLLEGSGTLFSALGAGLCSACEKAVLWSVSWSEEQRSSIAKPCKPYSTSFKNRRCASDGLGPPQCVPKAFILVPKSLFWRVPNGTQHLCSLARDIKSSF